MRASFAAVVILFSILSAFADTTTVEPKLGPNDVSILFPLPNSLAENGLWKPNSQAKDGELLPEKFYQSIPSIELTPAPATPLTDLRVIALRADPCFEERGPGSQCLVQLRLVWQPVRMIDGEVSTVDAALHSFYELSADEFQNLAKDISGLREISGRSLEREALNVHPILKEEQMRGPYSRKLQEIFFNYLGEKRLRRITFMQVGGQGRMWVFGGFDFTPSGPREIIIPRIGRANQIYVNIGKKHTYYEGRTTPSPQGEDTINLITALSRLLEPKDEPQITEEVLSIARIENPQRHNPNTMDCVSCHIAQPARVWATRQYPWLMLETKAAPFEYKSSFPLANTTPYPGQTNMLRVFGYDGKWPFISQRVINETAATLDKLFKK